MKDLFEQVWAEQAEFCPMLVQDPAEMFAAFCLIRGTECSSYLEVGSCYGASLYIFAHALQPGSRIVSVDLGEDKSVGYLEKNIERLRNKGFQADLVKGSSQEVTVSETFDAILIDAAHDLASVRADGVKYSPLAKKLILYHDIIMDGPGLVFKERGGGLRITGDFAPSRMGYGIQFVGEYPK